jgi:peptidoglycan/xylan/chitin deacetylase (PgdA/CDA1 family)
VAAPCLGHRYRKYGKKHVTTASQISRQPHSLCVKPFLLTKHLIASTLYSVGLLQWKLKGYSGRSFAILMYHRIVSLKEAYPFIQPGMYVQAETFERHLQFLINNFNIAPLSEVPLITDNKSDTARNKPLCFLTFDDGWKDFYDYAYPLLKSYQVPATVFLPTGFIGTDDWFWTDRFAYLFSNEGFNTLRKTNIFSDRPLISKLLCLHGSPEKQLEAAIDTLKHYREDIINEVLMELAANLNLTAIPAGRTFLTWNEVREMSKSGFISFGSHTANHKILTTLSDEEIYLELNTSREKLIAEQAADPSFIPFCYPNGNYSNKIALMVMESGYAMAVTTDQGWNSLQSNPFQLKRIGMHQDIASTEPMLECRICNIF